MEEAFRAPVGVSVARVPAGHAMRWWSEAGATLFARPRRWAMWVAMTLTFLAGQLLYWLPFVGMVVSFVLGFVMAAGMMVAAEKSRRDQAVHFLDLFEGFGRSAGALVGAAIIVLLCCTMIGMVIAFVGVGTLLAAAWEAAARGDLAEFSAHATRLGWFGVAVILGSLLLLVPVFLAAWLAPALIILRGVNPIDALQLSCSAALRNTAAVTWYGILGAGLLVVSALPLFGWLFFFLVLPPLCALSTHAAFHDLFEGGIEVLDAAP